MPRSKQHLCQRGCFPSPLSGSFSPSSSWHPSAFLGVSLPFWKLSRRLQPLGLWERMAVCWFLFRGNRNFYLVSQLSWVVLCDSLWYACRVTSKQARINSRFLGGLCFSGLLISLSLLCSLDADIWKKFLSRPALPFILRLLRGLAIQHPATQVSN